MPAKNSIINIIGITIASVTSFLCTWNGNLSHLKEYTTIRVQSTEEAVTNKKYSRAGPQDNPDDLWDACDCDCRSGWRCKARIMLCYTPRTIVV